MDAISREAQQPTGAELGGRGLSLVLSVGVRRDPLARSAARERRAATLVQTRSIRRRSGEAKAEVLALTAQTGKLLEQTIREARKLAATARRRARGRGARAKLRACAQARGARRSLREGDRADQQAGQRREDHRPADLAVGPGRPPDP